MNFLVVLHILIALALIALVLVQDSKGGGALGIGGGSNSLLGATGAQTLYAKMTRWAALIFGITCILLSVQVAHQSRSVIDNAPVAPAAPVTAPENNTQPQTK